MERKLKLRFKLHAIIFIFIIVLWSGLFSFAYGNNEENALNPFVKEFITNHLTQIGESEQLIFAINTDSSSSHVTIYTLQKRNGSWHFMFPALEGLIGEKGFAAIDMKKEGDDKTPTGIFPLGIAFGYEPSIATKMVYRQATDEDFWVDDANSKDYNRWVKGKPDAASFEKMRREDDKYKYGVVIEYNMRPIVKGKGSAIFLHVWKPGESTSGCVAMSEETILKILGWLNPGEKPLIIMGTESELGAMKSAPDIVDIKEVNPRIIVDMKYATEDNFTKKKLYDSNTCFLRKSTAVKLDAVQKELEKVNLGLKVWDCYRPLAVQQVFWAILPDERYVASPREGSRHNRASAVDVTLVDSQGKELQMPTGFDDFSPRAHHCHLNLSEQAIRNRELLKDLMEKAGFIPLPEEWWHYDDQNWVRFEILDVPFDDLLRQRNEQSFILLPK